MELPGEIGPYPVVRRLGAGGMGVVYLVRDPSAGGREVALKLQNTDATNARLLERFMREAKILASVQHPGVVRIHTTGWLAEGPFLLMDWVEGQALSELGQALSPDVAPVSDGRSTKAPRPGRIS